MVAHRNSGESESKVSEARTGMGTASERLVAPLARRRLQLKEKGKACVRTRDERDGFGFQTRQAVICALRSPHTLILGLFILACYVWDPCTSGPRCPCIGPEV